MDERQYRLSVSGAEFDTLLAALRLYQLLLEGRWDDIAGAEDDMREIATCGGEHDALSVDEIEDLLAREFGT